MFIKIRNIVANTVFIFLLIFINSSVLADPLELLIKENNIITIAGSPYSFILRSSVNRAGDIVRFTMFTTLPDKGKNIGSEYFQNVEIDCKNELVSFKNGYIADTHANLISGIPADMQKNNAQIDTEGGLFGAACR